MAVVKKYALVVPKNVSSSPGYTCTWPTPPGSIFQIWNVAEDYQNISLYDALKDRRQVWVMKGEEADINAWITANSDMVTEKTFAEADAIGKELQPARQITVHKVITEGETIISEEDILKDILVFDLASKEVDLGI